MTVASTAQAEATLDARERLSIGLAAEIGAFDTRSRRLAEIAFFSALCCGHRPRIAGLFNRTRPGLFVAGVIAPAAALNAFYLLSHDGHHHLLFARRAANHATNVALCGAASHSPSAIACSTSCITDTLAVP